MASDDKSYMTSPSLIDRVTKYITLGGRPEYQDATEHPKTLSVYDEPYSKDDSGLGTFDFYKNENGTYTKGSSYRSYSDPFEQAVANIDSSVSVQTPKVKIDGNKIVIQGTQDALNSPLTAQIEDELQALKGADLSNEEVQGAVDALNEEIRHTLRNWALQGTINWTEEEFTNYQRLLQTMRQSNPLNSTETFKAKRPGGDFYYDENGEKILELTPQEWIDYWKKNFSSETRNDLFMKSQESADPYERVMALIMSAGLTTNKDDRGYNKAIYGYDFWEYINRFWETAFNNYNMLNYGIDTLINKDANTQRVEQLAKDKGLDITSAIRSSSYSRWSKDDDLIRSEWTKDEDSYNKIKEAIKGKSWDELSDAERLFVIESLTAAEHGGTLLRPVDRQGPIWEHGHEESSANLNDMASDDKEKSIEAIKWIMDNGNYDDILKINSNVMMWAGKRRQYAEEPEEKSINDSLWAEGNVGAGRIAGTIARYAAENIIGKVLTGGHSMNKISDAIGEKIVGWLSKHNISPVSSVGQGLLKFTANLIGTIPEDIVQNAVDNVLTDNADQNQYLLDPAQMTEGVKQNLLIMTAWNAILAGVSGIKKIKFIRQMKKLSSLSEELDFPEAELEKALNTANDAANVVAKGGHFEVSNGTVYAVDADGNRSVMKDLTVEQAQMMNKAVADAEASGRPIGDNGSASSTNINEAALPTKTLAELQAEKATATARLEQLQSQRKAWEQNDWKDENGVDVKQREQTEYSAEEIYGTSKLERLDSEIDATKRRIMETDSEIDAAKQIYNEEGTKTKYDEAVEKVKKGSDNVDADDAARAADNADNPKADSDGTTTRVDTGTETEAGTTRRTVDAEGQSTGYKSLDNAINTRPEATPEGIRRWHPRALNAILREAATTLFKDFKARFGDVQASDFDWVNYNISKGKSISEIIGTENPVTHRVVTQNMIDAMKWWADHPMVRILREQSREGLGKAGDYNRLGYLPHTAYDPSLVTIEEAKAGQLWKRFTGKSVENDAGEFVGYGGDLEGRYRTYASNMLWDMNSKSILAAKLIEEAELDGKKLTPDEALKMADDVKKLDEKVNNSKSSKSMAKGLSKDGSAGIDDFKKANEEVKKEAPKSGAGKAVHDAWGEAYVGHNQANVVEQPKRLGAKMISLNDQADVMRGIVIDYRGRRMNMYESGAGDLTYSRQNAIEFVNRVQRTGSGWREPLIEYIIEHSRRSRQYAEQIADNMLARMAKEAKNGKITKASAIVSLSKSFKSEAWSRYRRFLALAKFEGKGSFNAETTAFINDFTFRHMQMDNLINNAGLLSKISNALVDLRYDALFYGNLKNALLQVSELSRLFTSFKLGDVGSMLKRLATDADFRERVNLYVQAVAPESSGLKASLYDAYGQASDAMEVKDDGVHFKKLKQGKKALDDIGLAPINAAESLKNRTLIAALVSEADRLREAGYIKSDNEYLMHLRRRFERVGLAQNEMGRLGLASSPIARPLLFLQNFQIRELGMHYYNIFDPDDLETGGKLADAGVSKGRMRWEGAKYLMKVFGTKLAVTLILARLGYSASQTLGIDPFGLANNYDSLTDEERTWVDDQISHGVLTPLVSSGITSIFSDLYFMAREAYEDANRTTVSEEARANLNKGIASGLDFGVFANPNTWAEVGAKFIPGSNTANRIDQMNQMMSTGWATSASGNKMYTAPDDALNTVLGYLFGRSATQNAVNYQQTYGNDLGQTLSRTVGKFFADAFGGGYDELDAIDQENFTDWFDGSDNDTQQFEKGRRSFRKERDRILDTYEEAIRKGRDDDQIAEAKNDMNKELDALYDRVGRFVDAYEKQHGAITGKMVKDLINLMNIDRKSITDTPDEMNEKGLSEYDKALERYVQHGLPAVGTYTGPTKEHPETELKYQGSPQWRVKSGTKYDLRSEVVAVLDAGDAMLKDMRKDLKDSLNDAYDKEDYDEVKKIQKQYLTAFDSVVGPILATYGSGVLSNGDVVNQLEAMLSADSGRNLDFVPRDDWSKGTNGRYISSKKNPLVGVNLKKWLKERYSSNTFSAPTIRSGTTGEEDIDTIKQLIDNGQTDMARAKALSLKVRIDNQKRTLSNSDYQWLLNFLNNGGTE